MTLTQITPVTLLNTWASGAPVTLETLNVLQAAAEDPTIQSRLLQDATKYQFPNEPTRIAFANMVRRWKPDFKWRPPLPTKESYWLTIGGREVIVEPFQLTPKRYGIESKGDLGIFRIMGSGLRLESNMDFGLVIIHGKNLQGLIKGTGFYYCTRLTFYSPIANIFIDSHLPVHYEDLDIFEEDFQRLLNRLRELGVNPRNAIVRIVYGTNVSRQDKKHFPGELVAEIVEDSGFKVSQKIPAQDHTTIFEFDLSNGKIIIHPRSSDRL